MMDLASPPLILPSCYQAQRPAIVRAEPDPGLHFPQLLREQGHRQAMLPGMIPVIAGGAPLINIAGITGGSGYQTHNVPLPSAIAAGDLIIVVGNVDTGSGARTISTPSGYSSLYNAVGPANLRRYFCFYKTAAGTETTVSIAPSSTNTYCSTVTIRVTGWLAMGISAASTGSSATADPPSVTPSWGAGSGTLALAVTHDDIGNLGTPTFPADYPVQQMIYNPQSGAAWSRCTVGALVDRRAAFDPGAIAMTGSGAWAATTICVRSA